MKTIEIKVGKDFSTKDIAELVHAVSSSISCIAISKGTQTVDLKSILGVFSLGLKRGNKITVSSEDGEVVDLANAIISAP